MNNILTYIFTFSITFSVYSTTKCGYESCPISKPGILNVHIIPHTHDDVGWLKTYDQYFYGSATHLANAGVQYILDSVLEQLRLNPERRFIYVETAFFYRWFTQLYPHRQREVAQYVQSGQLEFIGGGWSMNDEAAAHYHDIIDQMTFGLRTLNAYFGECGMAKIAWQIDPFGHSREQASLFSQMGFDGLFVGRIDYDDKNNRLQSKSMEFIWNSSSSLKGPGSSLFTGALYNTYSPPPGFCFDLLCSDEPIIDDKSIPDYNVPQRVSDFYKYVTNQAKYFHTNNVAITMGNDFNYQQAGTWFKNLDKLIKYVNEYNGTEYEPINAFYSTPSCYLKALNDANVSWPIKDDDFFPYASDPHAYWTGYFTSRSALKGNIRKTNNILQVCKQLDAMTTANPKKKLSTAEVDYLRRAQGVVQHHDAVTGTAKQAVTDDYARLLYEGVVHCQDVIDDALNAIGSKTDQHFPKQIFCNKLNVSECHVSEQNDQFIVTIYNPIGRPLSHHVRIPVNGKSYVVSDSTGREITSQLVPIPTDVLILPERNSTATQELVFIADLPPLGYETYFIQLSKHFIAEQRSKVQQIANEGKDVVIKNDFYELIFDGTTGLLKQVTNSMTKTTKAITQNFYWYRGMNGDNRTFKRRASGAYIFRPNGTEPNKTTVGVSLALVQGEIVQEIHQTFNDWVSQVIRLYKNSKHVEMEWVVGPIPFADKIGKEIITRFDTSLQTEGTIFTDTNGREILRRLRNSRPAWHLNVTEPISGNYYPIINQAYIKDMKSNDAQLSIITDRSVGVASIKDGSIETMIHRRLLHDDAFGVGEPLNETGFDGKGLRVRGKTILLLNDIESAMSIQREVAQRVSLAPLMSFSISSLTPVQYKNSFISKFSGLKRPLPPNVQLLTMDSLGSKLMILRFEHFYAKFDDPKNLSLPVTIDLKDLFTEFTVLSLQETMLAADRTEPAGHFKWKVDDNKIPNLSQNEETMEQEKDPLLITLNPMQIRTFIARAEYKK